MLVGVVHWPLRAQRSAQIQPVKMRELGCHAVMLNNEKRLLLASLRVLAPFLSTC